HNAEGGHGNGSAPDAMGRAGAHHPHRGYAARRRLAVRQASVDLLRDAAGLRGPLIGSRRIQWLRISAQVSSSALRVRAATSSISTSVMINGGENAIRSPTKRMIRPCLRA